MALERPPGAIRFTLGVDVQHDPGDLAPIGAFGIRIEQPQIGNRVFLS
jgi:hypothetical protein